MNAGCRGEFHASSRAELIEYFALDAFEEVLEPTLTGFAELDDDQRAFTYEAVKFGVRVACTTLGVVGDYEEEYQALLGKLKDA